VVVIENQDRLVAGLVSQFVDQRGHQPLGRGRGGRAQQGPGQPACPRPRLAYCGDQVMPEPGRVVVTGVQRQPSDRPLAVPGPVGQQRRLAKSRRRAHQYPAPRQALAQRLHQTRARHKTRRRPGHVQLGRQQDILPGHGGPGRGRRRRVSHRRPTAQSSRLIPRNRAAVHHPVSLCGPTAGAPATDAASLTPCPKPKRGSLRTHYSARRASSDRPAAVRWLLRRRLRADATPHHDGTPDRHFRQATEPLHIAAPTLSELNRRPPVPPRRVDAPASRLDRPGRCTALAAGWSHWSARPLSTLRPGFADIHACDQAATERIDLEDYSLGEHGAVEGPAPSVAPWRGCGHSSVP